MITSKALEEYVARRERYERRLAGVIHMSQSTLSRVLGKPSFVLSEYLPSATNAAGV
jgi:hypothetical protein